MGCSQRGVAAREQSPASRCALRGDIGHGRFRRGQRHEQQAFGSVTSGMFNDLQFLNYPRAAAKCRDPSGSGVADGHRDFPVGRCAQRTGEVIR